MSEKIVVPTLGESVTEATVAKWLKNKGDKVLSDEPLVELETDKVNVEVPSPSNGVLENISVEEGETVNVGALLGSISPSKSSAKSLDDESNEKKYSPPKIEKSKPKKEIEKSSKTKPEKKKLTESQNLSEDSIPKVFNDEPLSVVNNNNTRILWNGPKNWLLVSKKKDLLRDISLNFNETDFAVTDLSHSRAIIEIEGRNVKEVLKKGCPFNFNTLKKDNSINSTFNGIAFTVDILNDDPQVARIFALRSFGESLYHSITDASLEFGYKTL